MKMLVFILILTNKVYLSRQYIHFIIYNCFLCVYKISITTLLENAVLNVSFIEKKHFISKNIFNKLYSFSVSTIY